MGRGISIFLVLCVSVVSACGDSGSSGGEPSSNKDVSTDGEDTGTIDDDGGEAVGDTGLTVDTGIFDDTGVSFDSGVDVGFDSGLDVGFDSGVDVGFDSGIDVGFDLGFVDMGIPDTGILPDTGVADAGVVPVNPALEGVACISSFGPTSTSFVQDNCAAGHLCIPWDDLNPVMGLTGPVQACVRPCTVDADCGQNANGSMRHCVDSGFTPASGAPRICVDELAPPDQFCGFSRLTTSRLPNVQYQTGPSMVGCSAGTTCQLGFFGDVHVDEGVCLSLCNNSSTCPPSLPYCNPDVFSLVGGGTLGVCSDERRGLGALCGTTNPADLGFTTGCDTSTNTPANTVCVPGQAGLLGFDLPADLGLCATICNATSPCGSDPVRGQMTCSPNFLVSGGVDFGLCGTGCTSWPDNCGGAGAFGAGRFCTFAAQPGAEFCADIRPPTLTPGSVVNGIPQTTVGDNCLAGTGALSCPEGSTCYANNVQGTQGACYYGCSRAVGATNVCSGFLGTTTATCAAIFVNTQIGLCGI